MVDDLDIKYKLFMGCCSSNAANRIQGPIPPSHKRAKLGEILSWLFYFPIIVGVTGGVIGSVVSLPLGTVIETTWAKP